MYKLYFVKEHCCLGHLHNYFVGYLEDVRVVDATQRLEMSY